MQRSASPDITDIGASLNRNVGRPRKPQPTPTPVTSQPSSSPQDVLPAPANDVQVPEQSPPPVVKRGRGRPKKSIDLVQPIPVSPATPPTPPPTGKRRGRKPKASKETVESPNIDVSEPVPEDMDISDGPHQLTDLNIRKDGVDSVVTKMETEDIPETSSFFSSILKSEQPFGQQTGVGIPGLDLNDGDGSSNAPFVMDNPISFPFGASSGVDEECKSLQQLSISNKVKAPKSTVDTEVKTEEATDTNEENESSKVRRSSRIKTLEERGSRGRRREVVSSLSDCSGISRSNLSLNEDDSNSNSSFNTGGTTSGYSSPSREYAGSSLANSYSTPNLHALGTSSSANSSSKPLKVKSRWRYSLDAESLKSFNSSGDSGVSDSCVGSNAVEEFMRPENCVQRSGHLLFDGTDSELLEKLKRFEGIDESIYKNEGRKKLCKEGKGMSCDCQLTNEDLIRGETGCGDDCLNRLLMVECGNECVLGKRCSNKRFQRKEYAPLEVFKTEKKGHGLRTLNAINEGGFVIEYVGEVLDVNEFEKRTTAYAKGNLEHFYFMALKSDAIIDATQKGNCSRFINHSCEPNCETQKWTVNGEVRIGFFAIADLRPGDEITFDYQFQRYGKKAQRCFCMADSCRGWIGDEDDDAELAEEKEKDVSADVEEAEVEDSKVKPKPKAEKKKRKNVQLEDMAFREELAKLETSGLKNRNHTLTLSRLMVRAESWDDRERLLKVLINGGTPCRRLFLDYHGLRLIWSWMVDLPLPHENGGPQLIRNDIYHTLFLQALQSLPIPNKTILLESKVLSLIEKWCTVPPVTTCITLVKRTEAPVQVDVKIPAVDSAATEEVIVKTEANEEKMDTSEIKEEPTSTVEGMQELVEEQTWGFVAISKSVLDSWTDLKEVFRIPKKERVEQMKEHEREADKGQQLSQPSVTALNNSYERDHRNKQMHRNRGERRVPVLDPTQNQFHRFQNRMVMPPGFSKEEWRRQFEQTVKQQEEQELLRKQQDALVILHQERCALVGLDPSITPIVDPHGVHYLDPKTVMWRPINVEDPSMPPELIKFLQLSQHPAPASDIPLVEPLVIVPEVESETGYPPWPEGLPGPPPLPPRELPKNWKMAIDDEGRCYYYHTRTKVTRWDPPNPYDVSSSESSESSTEEEEEEDKIEEASEGSPSISKASIQTWRTKLIERAERRKKTGLVQERIISPRGEDDKGFSKEMVKENKKKVLEEKLAARLAMKSEENSETETLTPTAESKKDNATEIEKDTKSVVARKVSHPPRKKSSSQGRSRRKDKQVSSKSAPKPKPKVTSRPDDSARTSASSSPIETELDLTLSQQNLDEDDETFLSRVPPTAGPSRIITSTPSMDVVIPGLGYDSRDIKHMKDKKVADKADRAARHAAKKKAMHQKKAKEKAAAEAADKDKRVSSKEASCIKDSFRNSIATVVVAHLNPYRKNEHIKNTDDFKHLARKITHAILLKELKHTRDVHSLEVTDSVKHKTKEYIKKFMARFPHGVYIRSPEQTQSK
ncbi:hypothetical protein Ocin01_10498 [Orchesella cincta]|uniref:[histone H3]-lysine(36) N-trimethyltransferase n=1 Tax=Orchesella cincta TaxID=48709 RepID=A0A1D2MT17_ORCCI|nr:hypothetical protein Ocin01_10498 [Orchesella cincta]